jgi:S-disulfanyl-L-cysteine oxidoreductase SoxD
MPSRIKRAVFALTLILLASCTEQIPETSMDGIYTAQQADRGAGLFTSLCERCHSVQEFTGRSFDAIWTGVPAAALFVRIANTMPLDQPGSLSLPQVTALMAHIFDENEMPAGNTALDGDMDFMMSITLSRPGQ